MPRYPSGLSAHRPASLDSVKLNYRPTANDKGSIDPYAKEISDFTDQVPDMPSSNASRLDYSLSSFWIGNPRARACYNNVTLGVKMGGLVGGIFGALAGTVYAVRSRQLLVLPATILMCGGSFGFFLGCGMIIRCETLTK